MGSCQLSQVNCQLMKTATNFTRKNWFKARPPDREKLKEDYSLLQSSFFQVEVALNCQAVNCQLSTVNCQLSTEDRLLNRLHSLSDCLNLIHANFLISSSKIVIWRQK